MSHNLEEYKADENFGNGLVYCIPEVEKVLAEQDAEIARLKSDVADLVDDKRDSDKLITDQEVEITTLKSEIESLKATHDTEMMDAGMHERRLKRALWLARANKAESEARGWYHSNAYIIKYDGLHNIKGVLYGKGFKRYPDEWMKLWIKIESLCLKKAEEYR